MSNKPYLLDFKPADARDLIHAAKQLDPGFGSTGIFTTSEAAQILREHGSDVRECADHAGDEQ